MQATLVLERIEGRVWQDREANVRWFLNGITSGQQTQRDSSYGHPLLVTEPAARFEAFRRGEWGFVFIAAAGVVSVHSGGRRLGELDVVTSCVGQIPSDSPRCHFDKLTSGLVAEVKQGLQGMGFAETDRVPTVDVGSEGWVVKTW